MRDAERRDFTINGLSVDADGVVHDHVGGLADIAARRVRFIGDAGQRIAEDYLRILRFFRIHAAYGAGEPDRAGYLACIGGRAGLVEPFRRARAHGDAQADGRGRRRWLRCTAMADGGLLLPIFGGVAYTGPFAAMIAAERDAGLAPGAIRRLGALAVAVTEDARRVAARLRLTNAEAKALDSMGHRWWRLAGMDEATARRRLYRLGEDLSRPAAAGMGAGGRAIGDTPPIGASSRRCRSAGARRNFRSRRPISSRAASPKARRSAMC